MDKHRAFNPAALVNGVLCAVALAILAVQAPLRADDAWLSSPDANRAAPAAGALAGVWRGDMETPEGSAELVLRIDEPGDGHIAASAETAAWGARRPFSGQVDGRSLSLVSRAPGGDAAETNPVELRLGLSHDNSRLAGVWHQPASGAGGRVELTREGGAAASRPEPVPTPVAPIAAEASRPMEIVDVRLTAHVPTRTRAGEEVSVRVEALNAADEPRIGTIAVSVFGPRCGIPVNVAAYDLLLPDTGKTMAAFIKDGAVWKVRPRSEQVRPTAPHVEIFTRDWPAGGRKALEIPVRFAESGTAQLFIRATFCRTATGPGVIVENIPPSGPPDEQGLPCMIWTIEVESAHE